MAYNPYYNGTPYFQQPNYYGNGAMPDMLNQQKMQYQQMPQQTNDLIFVLGQNEAESYPVAPSATVTMWDKNQDTVYIKSVNAQGVPSMEILDYTKRSLNAPKTPTEHTCKCGDNFVTKEEFKALQGKYDEIMSKLQALEEKPKAKGSKLTKGDDE